MLSSLPAWECGLKLALLPIILPCSVTPRVGVWIETACALPLSLPLTVTPRVGVWIETVLRV